MFRIKTWSTETDRDQGNSETYGTCQRCSDAIATADRIFESGESVCVEVETVREEVLVYHISLEDGKPSIEDNRADIVGCSEK